MAYAGVWVGGRSPIYIVPPGRSVTGDFYSAVMLPNMLRDGKRFHGRNLVFQQDSAPAHRMPQSLRMIKTFTRKLITPKQWPSYSPDLNPLDYCVWSLLKRRVYAVPIVSRDHLIARIRACWKSIPQVEIDDAIRSWPHRLRDVARANGGHIEQYYRL